MARSHSCKKKSNDVYEWIRILQEDPENEEVKETIVLHYTNLVESLARKYSKNQFIHEDLVQVGMIGLLAAVKRYDESFNRTFETFAIPTILGEIKRFIRDKTWSVHVPRRIKELGPRIRRVVDELTVEMQGSPTITDIAQHLDVSEEEVIETLEMGQGYHALSADRQIEADSEGGTVAIFDLVGERESGYDHMDLKLILEKIYPVLSEREQTILHCTFFENMSQKETGELLGISQMHVSRLQRRSLRKLRDVIPLESTEILK